MVNNSRTVRIKNNDASEVDMLFKSFSSEYILITVIEFQVIIYGTQTLYKTEYSQEGIPLPASLFLVSEHHLLSY